MSAERPRLFGPDDDRAFLDRMAAVPVTVPEELRRNTRAALEMRLSRSGRVHLRWRRHLALAGVLLAGAAAAYWKVTDRPARPQAVPSRPARPMVQPMPAEPAPAVAVLAEPRRGPASATLRRPTRAGEAAPLEPAVAVEPRGLPPWPLPEDELVETPASLERPAPRLVIAREGESEVALVLAGTRVIGSVRGTPVDLRVEPGRIEGKLGHRNVWIWLRGHEAQGDIAGIPVKFQLVDTRDGHQLREGFSVRTSLPIGATRVETTASSLAWSPGCKAPLAETAPGRYQGRCISGHEARVVIPPSWRAMPVLPRLILLSFFLTERDPALARLFGPP